MNFLSQVIGWIAETAIWLMSTTGYTGLFILMMFESMVMPVPSELVMPFAGFLAADGVFSFTLVIVISSLASLTGSLLSYALGHYGGNRLVCKYGKWFLLDTDDLQGTEKWFAKRGEATIFIARLIPVVRHLISIPAGIGKMNLWKFCIYTIAGATIWNTFLAWCGYLLGQHWNLVREYTEPISIAVAVVLVAAGAWMAVRHIKHKHKKRIITGPQGSQDFA